MNPSREEGLTPTGSNRPRPAEKLHESQASPFLSKIYHLVDDPSTNQVISWSQENSSCSSFVIWDPHTFSLNILPAYFKHNKFSNFIRQLNSYGFKKVNPDRWEFANAGFIRGHPHLMRNSMKRRAPPLEEAGFDKEVQRLRRDRQILMAELVKLRQVQKTTRGHIRSMEHRLRKTELKQHQTARFLARAIRNPDFMRRLSQTKDMRQGGESGSNDVGAGGLFYITESEDFSEHEVLDGEMSVVPVRERGRQDQDQDQDQDQLIGEFLSDWIKEELREVNDYEVDQSQTCFD